jgi:biopolymer transport protein ExbD
MAGVSTESGSSGRKSVDQNINMVPFIDLLVSLIAFLLMTAVWVTTGAVTAKLPENAPSEAITTPPAPVDQLRVELTRGAIRVAITAADVVTIERGPGELDRLRDALRQKRRVVSNNEVWVQPESAVNFNDIARVMDAVYEAWGTTAGTHPDRLPVTVRML